jgi:prepilin-type processing-associated H-X9-DG protein
LAAQQYTQDYDEFYVPCSMYYGGPDATHLVQLWPDLMYPYTKSVQIYQCPSDPNKNGRLLAGYFSNPTIPHDVTYCSYNMNAVQDNTAPSCSSYGVGYTGFLPTNAQIVGGQAASVKLSQIENTATKVYIVDGVYANTTLPNADKYIAGRIDSYCTQVDTGNTAASVSVGGTGTVTSIGSRHLEGYNALFADGHVKWRKWNTSVPSDWLIQIP